MADSGLQSQALEVDNFVGGKTDNYIAASSTQFQDAVNMVLVSSGDKAKLETRNGLVIYDEDLPRIPSNTAVTGLAEIDGTIFQMSARNVYYYGSPSFNTIVGPTSNPALSAGAATNYNSWAIWNKHLLLVNDALCNPTKIYNDSGTWKARTLGLPEISTSGISASLTAGASSLSYIYAFHYYDSYTTNSITYEEVGPTSLKTVSGTGTAIAGGAACSISVIPVLANGGTGNYNTTGIKVKIYRTVNNGSAFYYVGEVTNGTTTFSDTVTDATLITNASLYTDGGTIDFDPAPAAKFMIMANNTAFYLGVVEGGVTYPRKIRQAVPGSPYAAPTDFYDETEDDITGGGVVGINPIVFCQRKCYRIEGLYDEFGNGGFVLRLISNSIGCVANRSIVTTRDGIYFASEEGFAFTNGFDVQIISDQFPDSYKELMATSTLKSRIHGVHDAKENRVHWGCQRDATSNNCDIMYNGHLKWQNIPFTTWDGGLTTDNFSPTALLYYNGDVLMGDRRGYLLKFDSAATTDPEINTSESDVTLWNEEPIIYDYRSPAFDFGTSTIRKWVSKIAVNANNVSNLSLSVQSNTDNTGVFNELAPIETGDQTIWGSDGELWGDDGIRWNYAVVISHWRRMPSPARCMYKQVRFTNAYSEFESSTLLGTCSTNGTANTVTLTDNTLTFAPSAIDYYISFDDDGYDQEWLITDVADEVITVADPDGNLTTTSGRSFKIRGYIKGQVLSLISYSIVWAPITMTQSRYEVTT